MLRPIFCAPGSSCAAGPGNTWTLLLTSKRGWAPCWCGDHSCPCIVCPYGASSSSCWLVLGFWGELHFSCSSCNWECLYQSYKTAACYSSPDSFPPSIEHPQFFSVSSVIRKCFQRFDIFAAASVISVFWARAAERTSCPSADRPDRDSGFALFSICCMVRFDFTTVLSVRKRRYLVCLFLLCGSMVDTMSFPFQHELLWPTQDYYFLPVLGLVSGWAGLVQALFGPEDHLSPKKRNIMVLSFLSSPVQTSASL